MILVTGANGQLGTELRHLLDERNEEYVAVDAVSYTHLLWKVWRCL